MARNDGEAGRLGSDRLVLAQCDRDLLGTVGGAALADETDRRIGLRFELFGHLGDALVDFPIQGLVARQTLLSLPHRALSADTVAAGKVGQRPVRADGHREPPPVGIRVRTHL